MSGAATKAPPTEAAIHLGRGVFWHCSSLDSEYRPSTGASLSLAAFLGNQTHGTWSAKDIGDVIQHAKQGAKADNVRIFVPEAMEQLDNCKWDGSGHYDTSCYPKPGPPTLGQIIDFLQMLDSVVQQAKLTLVFTSTGCRASGALLAGAVLVLSVGLSAQEAWTELLKAVPVPSPVAQEAWDRFPPPFSRTGQTGPSSVTVLECLAGLEAARDNGWLGDYSVWDSSSWRLLRNKLDATWLIPDEILVMGHPSMTAMNPLFPGLLPSPPTLTSSRQSSLPSSRSLPNMSSGSPFLRGCKSLAGLQDAGVSPSTRSPSLARSGRHEGGRGSPSSRSSCSRMRCGSRSSSRESTASTRDHFDSWDLESDNEEDPGGTLTLELVGLDVLEQETSTASGLSDKACNIAERQLIGNAGFVEYLQRWGVSSIARFNHQFECPHEPDYVAMFQDMGFHMVSLPFPDGGVPDKATLREFLSACRRSRRQLGQRLALHCMGGLGRSGIMVGAYAVARHNIPGSTFLGWARLCRPGAVQTERQEQFLRSLKSSRKLPSVPSLTQISNTLGAAMRRVSSMGSMQNS